MAPREDDEDHRDLDAPTPPGGPQRQDEPDADVTPVQEENAATSLDQPSDGSGGE